MNPLRNSRHEAFARLLVEGHSQADAYREIYPASQRWKAESLHPMAAKMAHKVSTRVAELQAVVAEKVCIEKAEGLSILAEILRTPASKVSKDSRIVQVFEAGEKGVRIVIPSKIAAFAELAKSCGWYSTEKAEQAHRFPPDEKMIAFLRDRLEKIRAKK